MRNAILIGLLTACGSKVAAPVAPTVEATAGATASASGEAVLVSAAGYEIAGTLTATARDGSVWLTGEILGLSPGPHGFHIHKVGDCSAADFASAGPHFDPTDNAHGAPGSVAYHGGDLGNLQTPNDPSKPTVINVELTGLALDDGERGIIGRAVIVHANADDLVSQPAGNSGPRIACGVFAKK